MSDQGLYQLFDLWQIRKETVTGKFHDRRRVGIFTLGKAAAAEKRAFEGRLEDAKFLYTYEVTSRSIPGEI